MLAPTPPIAAILFDLDGTLVDSAPDLAGAADQLRTARGLPSLSLSHYRPHAGAGARGLLGAAFGIQPEHPDFPALREAFLQTYAQRLTRHTALFDGVAALIATLQDHRLPWGIVTNKVSHLAQPLIQALAPLAQAHAIVCGDTTAHLKPHPAPLLEAARQLGLPSAHCLYVGDDLRDIQAGRAAAMRTVAARYGYLGPASHPEQWGADAHIETPLQLLQTLALA